ncbi:hypothetical protein AXF42_Ash001288 [Apostasia shenzhenica]|uniref:Uncharacterized protein n=1 Tax=Apostasia shenzhenica TaxID=1088818 RepID=A0A2I0AUH4_9ASPA|nr:hypothetical protein AXF42_Ash001288 [Apostasia shenzhenica]
MEASATLCSKPSHLRNPAGAEAWLRLSVRKPATLEAPEELKRRVSLFEKIPYRRWNA